MKASYVPGSFYKRSHGSNMSRLNRQAVSNAVSSINSYGSSVFTANQSKTEGLNELIVKKVATRLEAEAKAKLQSAAGQINLNGLGAFTNTTA